MRVAQLAFEYRQAFNKDVVIDLVCYRRRGHNEGDDPSYTQPLMYDLIEHKRSVRKLYTEALIGRGDITVEEAEQALKDYQQQLERVFAEVRDVKASSSDEYVTVPDYTRLETTAADYVQALENVGLKPDVTNFFGGNNGRVVSVQPGPGTQLHPGDHVSVTVV